MRSAVLVSAVLAAACAARGDASFGGDASPGALAAPFSAWLEGPGPAAAEGDGAALTVVVVPLRPLGVPLEVRVRGEVERVLRLGSGGGRLVIPLRARAERVQVEVGWRDPRGAAGATAVLAYPARREPVAPRFEAIAPAAVGVGGDGVNVDRAVRIR